MVNTTVSSDYRVTIPKRAREALGLVPGQKLEVIASDGRIVLVPLRLIAQMRGFLKGINTDVSRDGDRY